MKRIDTLEDLERERTRLNLQRAHLEAAITDNFAAVKKYLKPVQMVKEGAENALFNKNRGVVYDLVGIATNAVIRNFVLKNKNFLVRLVVPILIRNTVNNLLHENHEKIFSWLTGLFSKRGHNHHDEFYYDRSTAAANN
ncbi:MAG: hypothetical protein ACHQNT_03735 [Bacteroidia bacterium]